MLELKAKNLVLQNEFVILQYLDERFPVPQLFPGDIDTRARVRELAIILQNTPALCQKLADRETFVFDDRITILDLCVAARMKGTRFQERVESVVSGAPLIAFDK